jgi:hypothetical protein
MAGDSEDKGGAKRAAPAAQTPAEPPTEPVAYLRESSDVLFGVGRDVLDGALVDAGLAHRVNLNRDEVAEAIKTYSDRVVVPGGEA